MRQLSCTREATKVVEEEESMEGRREASGEVRSLEIDPRLPLPKKIKLLLGLKLRPELSWNWQSTRTSLAAWDGRALKKRRMLSAKKIDGKLEGHDLRGKSGLIAPSAASLIRFQLEFSAVTILSSHYIIELIDRSSNSGHLVSKLEFTHWSGLISMAQIDPTVIELDLVGPRLPSLF